MDAEKDIPELDPLERTRMEIARETAAELVDAAQAGDEEGFDAAFAALGQTAKQVDLEAFLNSLHVPDDAGAWEDGLRRVLGRIPDGWGRWISCGKGWYPIVVKLDQELSRLFPDYTIEQVKEKFASLRFYCSYGYRVDAPADPEPQMPTGLRYDFDTKTWSDPEAYARYDAAHDAWQERREAYLETAEGRARLEEREAKVAEAAALVKVAEREAERTCERCGQPGELRRGLARGAWLYRLCADCGEGLATESEWDAWWADNEERVLAEEHQAALDRFVRWHEGKRILVCCADERYVLRVAATYARTPVEVERLLRDRFGDWDQVWIHGDACGEAAVALADARYRAEAEAEKTRRMAEQGKPSWQIGPVWIKGAPEFNDMGGFPRQGGGISTLLQVGMHVSLPFRDTSYEQPLPARAG